MNLLSVNRNIASHTQRTLTAVRGFDLSDHLQFDVPSSCAIIKLIFVVFVDRTFINRHLRLIHDTAMYMSCFDVSL